MTKESKALYFKNNYLYNFILYFLMLLFVIYLIKIDLSASNKYVNISLPLIFIVYLIKTTQSLHKMMISLNLRILKNKFDEGEVKFKWTIIGFLFLSSSAFLTSRVDEPAPFLAIVFIGISIFIVQLKFKPINIKDELKVYSKETKTSLPFYKLFSANRLSILSNNPERLDIYIDGRVVVKSRLNHIRPYLMNKGSVGRNEILYDFYFYDKKFNMNDILSYIENSDKKFNDLDENDISVIEMMSIR